MKFPHYQQLEYRDCGATCLKSIAKHYGKIVDIKLLREFCRTDRQGVSLAGLSAAAEQIGLRSFVCEVTFPQLLDKLPLPCVVHWDQNHFVVVYRVTNRKVHVSDPARQSTSAYRHQEFRQHWLKESAATGMAMALEPQPHFDKETNRPGKSPSHLSVVLNYLKRYRQQLGQIAVIMVIVTVLQSALPFVFRAVLDVGVGKRDIDFIYVILAANVVLILSLSVANFIREWIIKYIGARFGIALISDYLIKLMKMPLSYFEARMTGDILNKVQDHEKIKLFAINHLINIVFSALSLLVFSIILYSFHAFLFLIFVIGTSLYAAWVLFFMRFQEKLDWDTYRLNSENQDYWVETLDTVVDIKVNNYGQRKRWKWEQLQASLYKLNLKSLQLSNFQTSGSQLINGAQNAVITFYSAMQVLNGSMTLGMMISVQFILGFLNNPVRQFISFVQNYTNAKFSFIRLHEIFQMPDEEEDQPLHSFTISEKGNIYLKKVSFKYQGSSSPSLRDITLFIPKGKTTAVVGTSGSGKSTMLKVLLRLYRPTNGDIYVGGTNYKNIHLEKWRDQCAAVLQEGRIFNESLLNNIILDDSDADYDRLRASVEAADLRDFVDELPRGYHTRLGSSGVGLSQGQKQRVLIARALYRNAPYLFLDEATNALDSVTEHKILAAFDELLNNKTVIVAAHRLSTIKKADQIVVMKAGAIVEVGSHNNLLRRRNSYYKKLIGDQLSREGDEGTAISQSTTSPLPELIGNGSH